MINLILCIMAGYIAFEVFINNTSPWIVISLYWGLLFIKYAYEFSKGVIEADIEDENVADIKDIMEQDELDWVTSKMEDLKQNSFKEEVNKVEYDRNNYREKARVKYLKILNGIED